MQMLSNSYRLTERYFYGAKLLEHATKGCIFGIALRRYNAGPQ